MNSPHCFRCMMLRVSEAGELCRRCEEGWEPPRAKNPSAMPPLDQWTVEMLADTQVAGTVPGQRMYEKHEVTFTDQGMW